MRDPHISKILLVRLREIGDVVFTTPAVRALHDRFPRARISYLVEPIAAAAIASHPHVAETIIAPRRHLWADFALGRRLRLARYDLAVDFHGGPRASLLTWLSRAPLRIGYDVVGRGWMYTTRVHRPRELRPRHAVQNQWDLLTPLGIPPPDWRTNAVEMPADSAAAATMAARLAALGVPSSDRLILVHVSAGNAFRRWPQDAFATLVAGIASRHERTRVLVTSGPSEPEAAGNVVNAARTQLDVSDRGRVLAIGDCSLVELRALLDRTALYIGGDSGPLHIASTTTVPIVAMYGPTLPVRSEPWRDRALVTESVEVAGLECRPCDQRVCAPGDFRCLTRISPEAVLEAAERALARASGPR